MGATLWLLQAIAQAQTAPTASPPSQQSPAAGDLAREELVFIHHPLPALERLPCNERLAVLTASQQAFTHGPKASREEFRQRGERSDEAYVIQGVMAYRNQCGASAEKATFLRVAAVPRQDVREVLRALQAPTPKQRAAAVLEADAQAAIERLDAPRRLQPAGSAATAASTCAYGPAAEFSAFPNQRYQRQAPELDPAEVIEAVKTLRYWAAHHLGEAALCQGAASGRWTRADYFYWPRIVAAWQAAAGRPVTTSLSADDLNLLRLRLTESLGAVQAQARADAVQRGLDEKKAAQAREAQAVLDAQRRDRERRQIGIQPGDNR